MTIFISYAIPMKIWVAQINTRLGDLAANEAKIKDIILTTGKEVDLLVFSEMAITGYPLNDLLDNEDLVKEQKEVVYRIRVVVAQVSDNLKVILWCIDYNEAEKLPSGAMKKYNAAAVIGKEGQTSPSWAW